jgi:hypothetical protein
MSLRTPQIGCRIFVHFEVETRKIDTAGKDGSLGKETHYWLDGPGTESRCGGGVLHACPDRPLWALLALIYNRYRVSFAPGLWGGGV